MMVVGARPAMGKTAFAMNIAQDIVFKQHKKHFKSIFQLRF